MSLNRTKKLRLAELDRRCIAAEGHIRIAERGIEAATDEVDEWYEERQSILEEIKELKEEE